jgi:hypothetical protein
LLVTNQYVWHLTVLEKGIVNVKDRAPWIPKYVFYVFELDRSGDHLTA